MKYIKRIDEMFDSGELKSQYEMDYLSGKLNPKDIVKSVMNSKNKTFTKIEQTKFQKIHSILRNDGFLFFNAALNNFKDSKIVETSPNAFTYLFNNDSWSISFTISQTSIDKYTIATVFRRNNDQQMPEYVIGFDNYEAGKMCMEFLETSEISEINKFIKDKLINLMKYLKFDDYLNYNKDQITN